MRLPWCKLHVDLLDDPKMAKLSAEEFRLWIELLLLASEAGAAGWINLDTEQMAWRLRRDKDSTRNCLYVLSNLGLVVNADEGGFRIPRFAERQMRPSETTEGRRGRARGGARGHISHPPADTFSHAPRVEGEEEEEEEEEKKKPPNPEASAEAKACALSLLKAIQAHSPNFAAPKNPKAWSREIDRMIRLDKAIPDDILAVIKYAHDSNTLFWRSNILSPTSLRKQFQRLQIERKLPKESTRAGPAPTGRAYEKYSPEWLKENPDG